MSSLDKLTEYAALLEALVFASDKPVRDHELQHHLPDDVNIADVMAAVMQRYDASGGVELCRVADGWAFRTRPAVAERLQQHKTVQRPLSRAALEVLAIIAYHQPITRAEIEEIRESVCQKAQWIFCLNSPGLSRATPHSWASADMGHQPGIS